MIYYFITYPTLKTATIASGRSERAFGVTLLNLTVFRVSHQVRTEALSFLVSNKQLLILGIDVAAAFFSCIGDGIRDVKRVIIHQPLIIRQPILEEDMDKFFKLLRRATSLVQLKLELGNLPLGGSEESQQADILSHAREVDYEFAKRMREFVNERADVTFMWSAHMWSISGTESTELKRNIVRDILGKGYEDTNRRGVMGLGRIDF